MTEWREYRSDSEYFRSRHLDPSCVRKASAIANSPSQLASLTAPMRPMDVAKEWYLDYITPQSIKFYNKAVEALPGVMGMSFTDGHLKDEHTVFVTDSHLKDQHAVFVQNEMVPLA